MTKIFSLIIISIMFALFAVPVLAHGGNTNPNHQYYVAPEAKNCMGLFAKMHARDMKNGTKGLKHSVAASTHPKFGLNLDSSVHETMRAFQDHCGKHMNHHK